MAPVRDFSGRAFYRRLTRAINARDARVPSTGWLGQRGKDGRQGSNLSLGAKRDRALKPTRSEAGGYIGGVWAGAHSVQSGFRRALQTAQSSLGSPGRASYTPKFLMYGEFGN